MSGDLDDPKLSELLKQLASSVPPLAQAGVGTKVARRPRRRPILLSAAAVGITILVVAVPAVLIRGGHSNPSTAGGTSETPSASPSSKTSGVQASATADPSPATDAGSSWTPVSGHVWSLTSLSDGTTNYTPPTGAITLAASATEWVVDDTCNTHIGSVAANSQGQTTLQPVLSSAVLCPEHQSVADQGDKLVRNLSGTVRIRLTGAHLTLSNATGAEAQFVLSKAEQVAEPRYAGWPAPPSISLPPVAP